MPKMTMCYRCMNKSVVNGRCTICNAPAECFVPAENELVLPPGTKLDEGNIMVGARLGSGGFGITYVARDEQFGVIALKEFVPRYMITGRRGLDLLVNPDKQETYEKTMRSFRRESKLLSELHHPSIVQVLFEMQENNTAYYGMELLQGEDLGKHIRNAGKPMPPQELCKLLIPVIDALIYLHAQKALHRDLSPDNIFLRNDPLKPFGVSPCLIDFGAAFSARQDFTQTVPGVKKNGYSPLEQNWDRSLQGPFTDVYAFAATLYYALTMEVPLPAGDRLQSGKDMLKPPSSFNPEISEAVDKVIMHGLALTTKERIPNMLQLGMEFCAAVGIAPPIQWRKERSQWGNEANKKLPADPPLPVEPSLPVEPFNEPTPNVEPPAFTWPTRAGHSPANLIALFLDALILVGIPVLILALTLQEGGERLGLAIGMGLLLVLNMVMVCVKPRGTLGQRILRLQLHVMEPEPTLHALCYAALRAVLPLSVLDAFIGLIIGSTPLLEHVTKVRVERRREPGIQERDVPSAQSQSHKESRFVSHTPTPASSIVSNVGSEISDVNSDTETHSTLKRAYSAVLTCRRGEYRGRTVALFDAEGLSIGRDRIFATLIFSERNHYISHRQCELVKREDGWYLLDFSSYGTFINGKRVSPGEKGNLLKNGDRIQFGNEVFIFKNKQGGSKK